MSNVSATAPSYKGHRFPQKISSHAVWLSWRFSLCDRKFARSELAHLLRREGNDQVSAAVRAHLGEVAFKAAWIEGRAMALELAITYALADTAPE